MLSYFPDVLLFLQNVNFCSRKIPCFFMCDCALCYMIPVWDPIQYKDDTLPV